MSDLITNERLGDNDQMVPAVQASDINDGEIINKTQQETDDKGRMRFHYVLPDGSPLSSDWVMPDLVRSARWQWVEAVKGAIVGQAQRAVDVTMSAARAKLFDLPGIEIAAPKGYTEVSSSSPRQDPVEYARACMIAATEEADKWGRIEVEASNKKAAAEAAANRWSKVLVVLMES